MKLNCKQELRGPAGELMMSDGKALLLGPIVALRAAGGNGKEGRDQTLKAFDLALQLHKSEELTLSGEDQTFILECIDNDKMLPAWFKGCLRYLVDPETVPEDMRKRFDELYERGL